MKYYSTRDALHRADYSLKEAAFAGLAPDGGLFMPEFVPSVDLNEVKRLAALSYADLACYLADLFFAGDVPAEAMHAAIKRAYDFSCPLRQLGNKLSVLELFHGPTFAFKDFGARFMGAMLGLLNDGREALTVLTATSGDTGSAVAAGFFDVPGIDVVVLFPEGQVSPLQESQMTTLGHNIHPMRVRGCFDDCQALVKAAFNDKELRKSHNITSANSINILRWIPQSFYYFFAWAQWVGNGGKGEPDIVVPSGNYGNITAGMLAAAMGLPVRRFIAASNANSVIPEFLKSGEYRPRPSVRTVANAMDVGAPSNYERMMALYGNYENLIRNVVGFSYSDEQIINGIKQINDLFGFISDPHAATAFLAARDSDAEGFYLATAHCAKFGEVIHRALGKYPDLPEKLEEILKKKRECITIDNSLDELVKNLPCC